MGDNSNFRLCSFEGPLDKAGLDSIREEIEKFEGEIGDEKYLVFDFEKLSFINSESIGFLLTMHTRLVKRGKRLVVISPVDHVKDVLNVIGVLKIIDSYDSIGEFEKNS